MSERSNRRTNRLPLAAALLAFAGFAAAADVTDMQRQYFYEYCASCHGPMGRGDGPVAGQLKTPPADLTQLAKNNNGHFPYVRVRAIIDGRGQALGIHGPAEMPVWGQRFSDEGATDPQVRAKILSIVDYLVSIQEQ